MSDSTAASVEAVANKACRIFSRHLTPVLCVSDADVNKVADAMIAARNELEAALLASAPKTGSE